MMLETMRTIRALMGALTKKHFEVLRLRRELEAERRLNGRLLQELEARTGIRAHVIVAEIARRQTR